jgi:hypothetical protein
MIVRVAVVKNLKHAAGNDAQPLENNKRRR